MKANAPEKLYITNDKKRFSDKCHSASTEKYVDNDIEYTRTDAFIEKAAEWLEENLSEYCDGEDIEYTPSCTYNLTILQNERMLKDFKNYMKGE